MNYKLVVSYKGTNFHGWAIQKDLLTVQGYLQEVLFDLFKLKITVNGSGRTDAYVHSIGQTFNIQNDKLIVKPNALLKAINSRLNNDVRITNCKVVAENFHARFFVKKKTYCYKINIDKKFNVIESEIIYQYNKEIDIKKLKKILPLFIKKQNFLSFSTSTLEDATREILDIKIQKNDKYVYLYFTGTGFLRNMVRMIVGCFLAYNENKIDINIIENAFEQPKKGKIIYKAPGCGLYL